MSRLEEIKEAYSNAIDMALSEGETLPSYDIEVADLNWLINRVEELEYASKYNGKLNEFLQKRKLPPRTLGRHVADVVMDYVEDLEKSNKTIKSQTGHNFEANRKLDAENQRYKQSLEDILTTDDFEDILDYIDRITTIAGEALAGESE